VSGRTPYRRRAQNAALVVAALIASWALIELVVFPPLVRHLPLRLHEHLDEPLRLLAQSAKKGTIPHDYLAVLGDSYAQGRGDWLLEVDPADNPPFAAYHLVHARLGVDVLSFGQGAAGSLGAVVRGPAAAFAFLNSTLRYRIEPPRFITVLFYEGNDVQDNLRDLAIGLLGRRPSSGAYGKGDLPRLLAAGARDAATMRSVIRDVVIARSPWQERARRDAWTNDLVFTRFALRAVARSIAGGGRVTEQMQRRYAKPVAAGAVRARIGGRIVALPDGLQAPPLQLSDDEIALGVEVFGRALSTLHDLFPDAPLQVAYVPSPLSCYRLVGEQVVAERYGGGGYAADVARIRAVSRALAASVAAVAAANGAEFVDAGPAARARAEREVVHGPRDWEHFNRAGQEALADAIVRGLLAAPGR